MFPDCERFLIVVRLTVVSGSYLSRIAIRSTFLHNSFKSIKSLMLFDFLQRRFGFFVLKNLLLLYLKENIRQK